MKLYLYNNEHGLALSHHNTHMRKFADFSRGWGIGEETFEFWSWLTRQCVVSPVFCDPFYNSTLSLADIAYSQNSSNKARVQHSRFPRRTQHPPPPLPS